MNTRTKRISAVKIVVMMIAAYVMMTFSMMGASAAGIISTDVTETATVLAQQQGGDGWSNIIQWISNITNNVKLVAYTIAALAVVVLGIIFIAGGGQSLSKGKGMAIGILVGVAVVSFGVGLIDSLKQV